MAITTRQLTELAWRTKPRPVPAPPPEPAQTRPQPAVLKSGKPASPNAPGAAPAQPCVAGKLTLQSFAAPQPEPETKVSVHDASPAPSRLDKVKALQGQLTAIWPAVFNPANPVALKIGIFRDLIAAMPGTDSKLLGQAIGRFTSRAAYQNLILTAGSPRYDLDGDQCGTVTAEEVDRLLEQRRRHAQKLAKRFTAGVTETQSRNETKRPSLDTPLREETTP